MEKNHVLNQSLSHSPSLFNARGNRSACASEYDTSTNTLY